MKINWARALVMSGLFIMIAGLLFGVVAPVKQLCGGICMGPFGRYKGVRITTFTSWVYDYTKQPRFPEVCQWLGLAPCTWEFKLFVDTLGMGGVMFGTGIIMTLRGRHKS